MSPESLERTIPEEAARMPASRQQARRALIILSFILYPVTFAYVSCPIITEAAGLGIVSGGLIVFCLLFISSLVLGRLWCGYLCPAGGLQEACNIVLRWPLRTKRLDWLKYLVFLGIFGSIALAIWSAGGLKTVDFLYRTQNGISILAAGGVALFLGPVLITLLFTLIFGKRGFCHTFCPIAVMLMIGRKIRNIFRWPALHLEADKDHCTGCMECSEECPMSLDVNGMVREGRMEQADCILCGACVDICPKNTIVYAWSENRSGRTA
ncbi:MULTISPECIES: 4Fe-4S binding protein [unclassified Methanoregula]|uniref:4Fe-4S binding protein n=1 Tax=unclassified Methanoregula TaxID=2649730 RepID=UPI0009D319E9|nr:MULTISPECIES: 4Fe-4S binding protein [unclassified Methanoregula]OPX62852.1 MAG: quinol dehydrogenase membrane component [Methanoregula sp. PtaB.Bin085]OPY35289.1 MAG: quinol dehydrogenase membrane component [Methanoregula sp. PtaU1.Bin006]